MHKKKLLNNVAVGVDIESINNFKKINQKKDSHLLSKIFSKEEIEYCFSKKNPAQHLTARFSAKEAVIKALSSLNKKAPPLNKIKIAKNINHVPIVILKGYNIKLSLSHCEDKAIAFVILEVKNEKN